MLEMVNFMGYHLKKRILNTWNVMLTKHSKCLSRTCLPTAKKKERTRHHKDAEMKYYVVNKWSFLCSIEEAEKLTMTAFYSFVSTTSITTLTITVNCPVKLHVHGQDYSAQSVGRIIWVYFFTIQYNQNGYQMV